MARSREIEAPAKNDVYFGMWLVTFIASAVAVTVLCLEFAEYGWDNKPATAAAPALPAIPVREVKTAMIETPKPAIVKNEEPKVAESKPETVQPAPLPLIVTAEKPPETPKVETPAPTPTSTPAPKVEKPIGPVPGGFELPRRK